MRRKRRAFTLVELLVVIGIIGVLISILLPALGSARRQARTLECSTRLRSIGQACILHANNNQGFLPLAGRIVASPTTNPQNFPSGLRDTERRRYSYATIPFGPIDVSVVPFTAGLAPYLGVQANLPTDDWDALDKALNSKEGVWKRFMCPDTDSMEKAESGNSLAEATVMGQGTMMVCAIDTATITIWATNSDYAANEGVFGFHYDSRYSLNRLGGKLSSVHKSTEVVLFTDGIPRKTSADSLMPLGWLLWTPSLSAVGPVSLGDAVADNGRATSPENIDKKRHGGRMNVVYADGHVETRGITKEELQQVYLVE